MILPVEEQEAYAFFPSPVAEKATDMVMLIEMGLNKVRISIPFARCILSIVALCCCHRHKESISKLHL